MLTLLRHYAITLIDADAIDIIDAIITPFRLITPLLMLSPLLIDIIHY
jgi:hypothetical protein